VACGVTDTLERSVSPAAEAYLVSLRPKLVERELRYLDRSQGGKRNPKLTVSGSHFTEQIAPITALWRRTSPAKQAAAELRESVRNYNRFACGASPARNAFHGVSGVGLLMSMFFSISVRLKRLSINNCNN
jgi:hypothetical protein